MANRNTFNSGSGTVSGGDLMDNLAEKLAILFNAMILKPTGISNSGNDYTITIDPTLDADVVENMGFYIQPSATNTGAARMRVTSGNPYYDIVKSDGSPLASGEFLSTSWYFVTFLNGDFVILASGSASGSSAGVIYQEFLTTGTWNKPTGLSADAIVDVEMWGGGGGGGSNTTGGGGGGGEYVSKRFKASDLTSSVAVTVALGGAVDAQGGNSSFGAYAVAYGGGAGQSGTGAAQGGGGGGGPWAKGSNGAASVGGNSGTGSALSLGYAGKGASSGTSVDAEEGTFGGGGGGGGAAANADPPGRSVWGGGGGGGGAAGVGAISKFGGQGGDQGSPGVVPAGGGGRNAAGAAGKVIVRIIL